MFLKTVEDPNGSGQYALSIVVGNHNREDPNDFGLAIVTKILEGRNRILEISDQAYGSVTANPTDFKKEFSKDNFISFEGKDLITFDNDSIKGPAFGGELDDDYIRKEISVNVESILTYMGYSSDESQHGVIQFRGNNQSGIYDRTGDISVQLRGYNLSRAGSQGLVYNVSTNFYINGMAPTSNEFIVLVKHHFNNLPFEYNSVSYFRGLSLRNELDALLFQLKENASRFIDSHTHIDDITQLLPEAEALSHPEFLIY